MSGTLVGNNITIRISAAVSATASATSGSATVYTCPANSYAILNLAVPTVGSGGTVKVDGRVVMTWTTGANPIPYNSSSLQNTTLVIYVGPSQAVTVLADSTQNTAVVSGVCFTNSP